jgi:hypothetical protein
MLKDLLFIFMGHVIFMGGVTGHVHIQVHGSFLRVMFIGHVYGPYS